MSIAEELERLAKLRASGAISEGEYAVAKARLLQIDSQAEPPSDDEAPVPTAAGHARRDFVRIGPFELPSEMWDAMRRRDSWWERWLRKWRWSKARGWLRRW